MNMILGKNEADDTEFKYTLYATIGRMNIINNQIGGVY